MKNLNFAKDFLKDLVVEEWSWFWIRWSRMMIFGEKFEIFRNQWLKKFCGQNECENRILRKILGRYVKIHRSKNFIFAFYENLNFAKDFLKDLVVEEGWWSWSRWSRMMILGEEIEIFQH